MPHLGGQILAECVSKGGQWQNGPYLLALNLWVEWVVWRFFASSHSWSLSLNDLNGVSLERSIWLCKMASCTCHQISSMIFFLSWSDGAVPGDTSWPLGVTPISNLKGGILVVWKGWEFRTNWASGSHLAQSVCYSLQKILRYVLRVWLVLLDCPSVWGW